MFEKEAEEYKEKNTPLFNALGKEITFTYKYMQQAFKDGAEFGYNKANEWHYVKDGDLPKDNKQYLVMFFYNYKGAKEVSYGVRDNLQSDFEIHRCYTEQIIAWKEITLSQGEENDSNNSSL